jgi:membrane protease YdiL (CAAX protease family)
MWLALRYTPDWQHMGLAVRRLLPNIGLGLAAAAMWLPIVAVISFAVNTGTDTEYKHPLIEELNKEGNGSAYLMAVFCAVIVAPLVEEFFFRVLLQGWLQSTPWSIRSWWWLIGKWQTVPEPALAGVSSPPASPSSLVTEPFTASVTPAQFQLVAGFAEPPDLPNPYHATAMADGLPGPIAAVSPDADLAGSTPTPVPPIWPSFVVGILFGLAHFDYGLSFIPLSVLGIILGLLYRAKHSIWPCFVLHFVLNGLSMASLGIALLVDAAK